MTSSRTRGHVSPTQSITKADPKRANIRLCPKNAYIVYPEETFVLVSQYQE